MCAGSIGQGRACNPGNGILTSRIDVEYLDRVGIPEGTGEFLHEVARPREAVRLEENMHFAETTILSRSQSRAYLSGVVAVVIDDGDTADDAFGLEAPINAAKGAQAYGDLFRGETELNTNRDGRRCIQNVVATRHMKLEDAKLRSCIADRERGVRWCFLLENTHAEVCLSVFSVSVDPTLDARQHRAKALIVHTRRGRSIEGHAIHEFDKSSVYVFHVAVAIHVLAIQVCNDAQHGGEFQKGAVALVGFDDEVLRVSEPCIRAERVDTTADHNCWIKAAAGKYGGDHAGGRGLAVHAGDGYAVFQPHELGEHFGALDYGDFALASFENLRVCSADGGAGDDDVRCGSVGGGMALEDACSKADEAVGDRASA